MSRTRNFLYGLTSGYFAMAVNIVYTIASVPLALHYLPKEEFGLWAVVSQLAGYMLLIDFGMTSSTGRMLIDHKDDRNGGVYGSMLLTSGLVFIVQGFLVAAMGCLASPFVARLVDLPKQYVGIFGVLFSFQCVQMGLGFLSRFFGSTLSAHQRYDISNLAQASQLLMMLGTLWLGFTHGMGLYSMVASGFAGFLWSLSFQAVASVRLNLFPNAGCWGRPNKRMFYSLFSYGKDVFLMGLGWQLMSASQVIVISRTLGLETAATWSVCTKIFILAQQFVWRIFDFSSGAFSEMFARGELALLKRRFRETVIITASISVFVCAIGAQCNSSLVALWTQGKISWSPLNDALLGVLLILNSVSRCHGCFPLITKNVGYAKYIYFLEGVVFVSASFFASKIWGLPGIITCSVLAEILLPGAYGLFRSKKFFGSSYWEMTLGWLKTPGIYALTFLVPGLIIFAHSAVHTAINALILRAGLLTLVGLPMLWFLGLPEDIRSTTSRMLAHFINSYIKKPAVKIQESHF